MWTVMIYYHRHKTTIWHVKYINRVHCQLKHNFENTAAPKNFYGAGIGMFITLNFSGDGQAHFLQWCEPNNTAIQFEVDSRPVSSWFSCIASLRLNT